MQAVGDEDSSGRKNEVINFGCFADDTYSYVKISVTVGVLLIRGIVGFVVTGCSSGQGMMLTCNDMPGVICGYLPIPQDAYLFDAYVFVTKYILLHIRL